MLLIDLGSNSLRMCEFDGNRFFNLHEKMVSSALGLYKDMPLSSDAKDRIINALDEFSKFYDFNSSIKAVATEAFRIASDADEFFDQIYKKFGIKFQIISGELEAKISRLGAKNRLDILKIPNDNAIFIDLGGGSTEISYKDSLISFKFGIVKFLNDFEDKNLLLNFFSQNFIDERENFIKFYRDNQTSTTNNRILNFTQKITNDAKNFINGFKFDKVILTSGVPTSLIAYHKNLAYKNYNGDLINGQELKFDDLINDLISISSMSEIDNFFGKDRGKFIVYGTILLIALLHNMDKKFIVIDDGLLQGLAF